MRRILALTLAVTAAFLCGSAANALEIVNTWTTPRVYAWPPPADLTLEGAVKVFYVGDEPMTPVDADWVYPADATTWWAWLLWNQEVTRTVVFASDDGDTVTVTATREPARPLVPTDHTDLIIDIETERPHLWSPETGIYVWGLFQNCLQTGEAWERPATITGYDPTGAMLWTEPAGLRINGQSSRYHLSKGLRSYFDHDEGTVDWLEADLFGDGPGRHGRLVYKTSLLPSFMVSATMVEPLHQQLGHLGSRHRLVALYLESDYWGAYSLRERLDDHFIEVTHELAEDGEYTFIKDMESVEGNAEDWTLFLDTYAATPQPYGSHTWFENVAVRLDLPSYMDWLILNIVGASADNGWVNNMALLRIGNGPWRYIMWDEEALFGTENLESNHFRFYAAADEAEFYAFLPPLWSMGGYWAPHQPWRDLFRGLMQNSQFKALFSARVDDLLAGQLSEASLHARLDSLATRHSPEAANHEERWSYWPPGSYLEAIEDARGWLSARLPIVAQQKEDFFEHFAVPVELSVFTASGESDGAHLAWRTERERDNMGFSVWRSLTDDGELQRIADWRNHPELVGATSSDEPRDYVFLDATLPAGDTGWYQLRHEETGGAVVVHDWIERAGPPTLPPVHLNELMADNDSVISDEVGEYDDWLELVNIGDVSVSLGDLALSDDPAATAPWPLPPIDLAPGDHLLVWCDNDPEQGPLHADFRLAAAGESATLFLRDGDQLYVVDSVEFGPQAVDVSYGRLPDGTGAWQVLDTATPGAPNTITAVTPLAVGPSLRLRAARPNPAGGVVTLRFSLGITARNVSVAVYDLRGARVRHWSQGSLPAGDHSVTWDRRDHRGRHAAAGIYLVRVTADGHQQSQKLSLVR